ncbi:cell division protein FtsX [Candidatus Electronema sp. TJ]|uniref:cell division protein FtsX n=1 Tax=Candidatus Electronema sp. TJ TaxID=3401573 RepID=UPI003AA9DE4F
MNFLVAVFSQTWRSLVKSWRSQVLSLLTITLSILIFTFFYLVYNNALQFGSRLDNDLRLIVYLEDEPDQTLQQEYRHKIEKFDKVDRIEFVSKLEAYDRFKGQLDDSQDVLKDIPKDFLPPSIEIYPRRNLESLGKVKEFSAYLEELPGVLKVQYGREWVERFNSFVQLLQVVVFLSGGLLIMTTTFMIGHSIRLTVFSRKNELELLRLVGASNSYIRVPFFLEGALLGLFGSIAGLSALYLLFRWIRAVFAETAAQGMFSFSFFDAPTAGMIIILAVLLCAGGSFVSIRKILSV